MAYHPHPRTPTALPLSGAYERMLREGGHYTPRTDLYLSKGRKPGAPQWQQGIPRNPEVIEFYSGEFSTEPDPNVSNDETTGQLIRRMLLKHWSRDQILRALLGRDNVGGSWLRWQPYPDDTLDRFILGSRLPKGHQPPQGNPPVIHHPPNGNPPVSPPGNPPIPPPEGEDGCPPGFVFVEGIIERLLAYAEAEPRSRTDLVERGPIRHKGAAATYVDHLTEQGRLRWVPGWRTKPRGPVPKVLAEVVRPTVDPAALMASWLTRS